MPTEIDQKSVTFINKFSVTTSADAFESTFAETSLFMSQQPGFMGHTLLAHTDDPNAYVNIARWASRSAFLAALNHPNFSAHAAALRAVSVSDPNLYKAVLHRSGSSDISSGAESNVCRPTQVQGKGSSYE